MQYSNASAILWNKPNETIITRTLHYQNALFYIRIYNLRMLKKQFPIIIIYKYLNIIRFNKNNCTQNTNLKHLHFVEVIVFRVFSCCMYLLLGVWCDGRRL